LVVGLDEDTGEVLTRTPTGEYPDGLAYDPRRGAIWTTNETGGSETVIDAVTGAARGTVALGGEVGNVAYDPTGDQMLVAVQGHDELAAIDPATLAVTRRVRLPGCEHSHGLSLDPGERTATQRSWKQHPLPRSAAVQAPLQLLLLCSCRLFF
ncbi:MAG: hypothetical protein JWP64_4541, partial [Pseudonocardia sp.]|nr:hypothetical protein [Pseudonocardia sp.]